MRKLICLLTAFILCLSIASPAFAAETGFVPSITYKPHPEIVSVGKGDIGIIRDRNGGILGYIGHDCLQITPLAQVWDPEAGVPQGIAESLRFVYESLNDGSMEIPYEKHGVNLDPDKMVICDLFDASWLCEEHRKMLEEEGVTLDITFKLGVISDADVFVMTYDEENGAWSPIVKAVNNGDGTVTCTFEHLCVVEFSMLAAGTSAPAVTVQDANVLPWIIVLILAVVGVAVVLIIRKKKRTAV